MRKFVLSAIVLIVLVTAYWVSALVGAAELASAASRGDAEAVMQRVDLPALIRSLSGQIARAYLDQNPQYRKLLTIEQGFVGSAAAGAFNALLREVLTPETIAALLNEGRAPNSGPSIPRMPPVSAAFRNGPLQAVTNSYFDGPLSFVVRAPGADGQYNVHLHLSGMTWRLSGLDVPEEISARLAREVAAKMDGSAERGGG
jgi:hypothetical protein